MRTNIVIDDKLLRDTLRATGLQSKRAAVETGLKTLLRLTKQAEIRRFRGRLHWQGDLDALRSDRRLDSGRGSAGLCQRARVQSSPENAHHR